MAGADVNTKRDLAVDNAQQYVYARDAGHLDFMKKAKQCLDFVDSYGDKQWEAKTAATLRSQGKPVLTIGKIMPTIGILMGEQLQNQTDVAFRATSSGDPKVAEVLDKAWLHVMHANGYDFVKADAFDLGMITSRGFIDVRMGFDDNIMGDVRLKRLNPMNVVLDADASEYDPDEWSQVFITGWHTAESVGARYGKEFEEELKGRPQSAFQYGGADFMDFPLDTFGQVMGFQNLSSGPDGAKLRRMVRVVERQYIEYRRVPHFVEPSTGEVRPVPSNWDEERIRMAVDQTGVLVVPLRGKLIRWTVSADDLLLHHEESPYEHFTPVPFFPHLILGRTIGLVEGLIGSQEGLNKARSQELHIISSIANSGWKIRRGSLQNMTPQELEDRGAETGLVMELDNTGDAEKILPNQVPPGIDRVTYKFDQDLESIPNVGPGMRSTAREDVSGKALKQQEVRGTIGHGRPLANLVRTDEMVAKRVLSLLQRYYTDERVLTVVNRDPRRQAENIVVNQVQPDGTVANDLTIGEYDVITTPVQQREAHEDTVFDQLIAMREMGIKVSDELIITNSRLFNKAEALQGLEPTETDKRMSEIQLETAEAELEKLKAENRDRNAAAVQKVAMARRATAESQQGDGEDEAAVAAAELDLKRERMERELELERWEAEQELEIKREQMQRESRLKELQIRETAKIQRAQARNTGGNAAKGKAA